MGLLRQPYPACCVTIGRGEKMKRLWLIVSFILVFLLPGWITSLLAETEKQEEIQETIAENHTFEQMIRVKNADTIHELSLEEYVLCVLLGEMPADFEEEALKAQAVATRTYTLRKVLGQNKHDNAHICTDASCCQAFVDKNTFLEYKGTKKDLDKIEAAVAQTRAEVLTYQGKLIEATYFSCSGGMTEDALAVWGTSVPYLISVPSPGEEDSNYFVKEYSISKEELLTRLGIDGHRDFSEDDIVISNTAGGGVDSLSILGNHYSGTQVRVLLNLPSTVFSLSVEGDNVLITTKGYGHRVGMSQYGADAMAVSGKTYDEILSHYYPGTALEKLTQEQLQAVFDKAGIL